MRLIDLELARSSPNAPSEPAVRGDPPDPYPHQLMTYLIDSPAGRVILDALMDDDVTKV